MEGTKRIEINEYLSFFPAVDEPVLSSEVFVIRGREGVYLFDAGNHAEIVGEINLLQPKAVFLSHFHLDHAGQIANLCCEKVYAPKYTLGKIRLPQSDSITHLELEDGVLMVADEMPSTHSKGACILTLNQEITLLGDAIYREKGRYNVSKLHDMIAFLEKLDTKWFLCSHGGDLTPKDALLAQLREIYAKREKNQPYIF